MQKNMATMALPSHKSIGGILRYKHSEGPKRLQFLLYMHRANPDLSVLYCNNESCYINFSNNTIIPEKKGTKDGGSECGREWSCHGQGGHGSQGR